MAKKTTEFYLSVLGLTLQSTKEEIKKAYRKNIKQWHPDKFPNDKQKNLEATEKCKLINDAYDALKNYIPPIPKKSKTYYDHITWSYSDRGKRNIVRTSVDCLLVHSVGYDREEKILQILMTNNIYEYYGVPEDIYNEIIKAESAYIYYTKYIMWSYPGGRVGSVSKREVRST